MTIIVQPGQAFYPSAQWGTTGATLGVRLLKDSDGSTAIARFTTGIVEVPSGSGQYTVQGVGVTAPTTAGEYTLYWDDGAGSFAQEDVSVTSSLASASLPSGSDLTTLANVKAHLQRTDTTFDTILQNLITRASDAIMDYAQREFAPATASATRRFAWTGPLVNLAPFDCRSVSSVIVHPEAVPGSVTLGTSDYTLAPLPSPDGTFPFLRIAQYMFPFSAFSVAHGFAQVDITGAWGFAAVPPAVEAAAIETVVHWFRRGVAAFTPSIQNSESTLEQPQSIPFTARRLLDSYVRVVA